MIKVKKLLKDCVAISEQNGKAAVSVARDKDYLSMMIDIGFRFISYKNDSFVLREGLESASAVSRRHSCQGLVFKTKARFLKPDRLVFFGKTKHVCLLR